MVFGALLTLSSCDKGAQAPDPAAPGAARPAGPYFDVRGLLDGQIRQLAARHPGAVKEVSLRGSAPESVRVPQVKWADELQIFYQADINKAALRGAYRLDSAAEAGGAGMSHRCPKLLLSPDRRRPARSDHLTLT